MQVLLAVLTGGMLVAVPRSRFSPAVQALFPVLEAWLQFSLTPTVEALLAVLSGDLLVAVPLSMIFSSVQALLPVLGAWLQFSLASAVQALLAVLTGDLLVAVPLARFSPAVQALLPVLGAWLQFSLVCCGQFFPVLAVLTGDLLVAVPVWVLVTALSWDLVLQSTVSVLPGFSTGGRSRLISEAWLLFSFGTLAWLQFSLVAWLLLWGWWWQFSSRIRPWDGGRSRSSSGAWLQFSLGQ